MTSVGQTRATTGAATPTAPSWQGQRTDPTRVVLLRHGQTPLSVERRYSGRGNPRLTELGERQALGAASRIAAETGVAAVVSSPLERARQTAQAVVDRIGGEVTVEPGFIETDFGGWEGLTFSEAAARDPEIHARWLGDPDVPAPDGESFTQVAQRVIAAKDQLLHRYPGQTVIVVSHVTPIKTLLQHALTVGPELLFHLHLDLASVSVTEFYPDGGSVVRSVNETAHLG
ncbi:histidine phosphatase family protein [Gordonia otitidis]|uniref:histidine phosphatase family protein n=1 Tax=Gordonia otitidis TaxID=249058 RepID=UPI001D135C16|nr:histidine phosphatase family protein [Gordonia otitidis]UEA58620.1 histidine phosphatase family protein [Gordonia otitidis]